MLGTLPRKNGDSVWAVLDSFIPENLIETLTQRSGRASMFTASLEMAKQGQIEIRQNGLFSPIYIKQKAGENEE
jgi:segregation and condensation protein A